MFVDITDGERTHTEYIIIIISLSMLDDKIIQIEQKSNGNKNRQKNNNKNEYN